MNIFEEDLKKFKNINIRVFLTFEGICNVVLLQSPFFIRVSKDKTWKICKKRNDSINYTFDDTEQFFDPAFDYPVDKFLNEITSDEIKKMILFNLDKF